MAMSVHQYFLSRKFIIPVEGLRTKMDSSVMKRIWPSGSHGEFGNHPAMDMSKCGRDKRRHH